MDGQETSGIEAADVVSPGVLLYLPNARALQRPLSTQVRGLEKRSGASQSLANPASVCARAHDLTYSIHEWLSQWTEPCLFAEMILA